MRGLAASGRQWLAALGPSVLVGFGFYTVKTVFEDALTARQWHAGPRRWSPSSAISAHAPHDAPEAAGGRGRGMWGAGPAFPGAAVGAPFSCDTTSGPVGLCLPLDDVAQEGSSTGEARKGLTFSTPPPRHRGAESRTAFPANRAARSLQLRDLESRNGSQHCIRTLGTHARRVLTWTLQWTLDHSFGAREPRRQPRRPPPHTHTWRTRHWSPAAQDRRGAPLSLHANLNTGRSPWSSPLAPR